MVFTVTLMNPLASGHDGSWKLDLLMEAVVGVLPPPPQAPSPSPSPSPPRSPSPSPPSSANDNPAPSGDTGSVRTGGGGGGAVGSGGSGGGTSVARNNPSFHLPVDDVSDDDSESSGNDDDGEEEAVSNNYGREEGGGIRARAVAVAAAAVSDVVDEDGGGGKEGVCGGRDDAPVAAGGDGDGAVAPDEEKVEKSRDAVDDRRRGAGAGAADEGGEQEQRQEQQQQRERKERDKAEELKVQEREPEPAKLHKEGTKESDAEDTKTSEAEALDAARTKTSGDRGGSDAVVESDTVATEGQNVSSDDDVSSEDEPIAKKAGGGLSKPAALVLRASPAADGVSEVGNPPPSDLASASAPASPTSSARPPADSFVSPDSFASMNTESVDMDNDGSDYSLDETEEEAGSSSDEEIGDDVDSGYEVDVPYPPCSVMHKKRKTYKLSLCEECYKKYKRDLENAGADISDIDSDTGRPRLKKSPSRRRRRQGKEAGAPDIVGTTQKKLSRKLQRASEESRSSTNGGPKKRRKVGSVVDAVLPAPAPARRDDEQQPRHDKANKKKPAKRGKTDGKAKPMRSKKKRLSKGYGKVVLEDASSFSLDVEDLSDTSVGRCGGSSSNSSSDGDEDVGRGGTRSTKGKKRDGKFLRDVKVPATGGKKAIDLSRHGSGTKAVATGGSDRTPAPPSSGSQPRGSGQGRAAERNDHSRGGGDDVLALLMGSSTARRASSVPETSTPQQGSGIMSRKAQLTATLQGRATGAAATAGGSSRQEHLQLKRGVSLDTGMASSRAVSLSAAASNTLKGGALAGRSARPLGGMSLSQSKLPANAGVDVATEKAPNIRVEKRRAEMRDGQGSKPAKTGKTREAEDVPLPTPKSAYARIPHYTGVVRKVSNGKFFLWVHEKLHDGKPYDSAEACAKEYDNLTRPARGCHRGPKRNFGDARAPSHVETADLTMLSLGAGGGSRIAKKKMTSAYKNGATSHPPPSRVRKAPFFAPKTPPQAPPDPPRPPALDPLPSPPIVLSYNVSKIDLPMLRSSGAPVNSPAYAPGSKIRWAEKTTGRPADGLHVPSSRRVLPRRSGLAGGRAGRPVPDTRQFCARTGVSRDFFGGEPVGAEGAAKHRSAKDAPGVGGLGTPSEAVTREVPSRASTARVTSATPKQADVHTTVDVKRAEPVSSSSSKSSLPSSKPVTPVNTAASTPTSSPGPCLGVQASTKAGAQRTASATAPDPALSNEAAGVALTNVAGKDRVALDENCRIRERSSSDDRRASEHTTCGTTRVVVETPTMAEPRASTAVPLRDHLAQVRHYAATTLGQVTSLWHQPEEDHKENGDEEQGRELLQCMMMNGGAPDDNMEVCSEEADEDAAVVARGDEGVVAGGHGQKGYVEETAEQIDTSEQVKGCQTELNEKGGGLVGMQDDDDDGDTVHSRHPVVANMKDDEWAQDNASLPGRPHSLDTMGGDLPPLPPSPSFPPSTDVAGEDSVEARATVEGLPPPPVTPQVTWSAPLKLSRRINNNRAIDEPSVPRQTAWVQPRRVKGNPNKTSSSMAASIATPASTATPPPYEGQLQVEPGGAHSLPGSAADEMLVQGDPPLLSRTTAQQVAWRPPSRVGPKTLAAAPAVASNGCRHGQSAEQRDETPAELLQIPSEVAGLKRESLVEAVATATVPSEMPQVLWRPPGRLAYSPRHTQDVGNSSPTVGSVERPPDEGDAMVETECVLTPFGDADRSPGERDEIPIDQWNALLRNANRSVHGLAGEDEEETAPATTVQSDQSCVLEAPHEANGLHQQSNGAGPEVRHEVNGKEEEEEEEEEEKEAIIDRSEALGGCTDGGNGSRALAPSPRSRSRSTSSASTTREGSSSSSRQARGNDDADRSLTRERNGRPRGDGKFERARSRDSPCRRGSSGSSSGSSRSRRSGDDRDHDRDDFRRDPRDRRDRWDSEYDRRWKGRNSRRDWRDYGRRSPQMEDIDWAGRHPRRERSKSPQRERRR